MWHFPLILGSDYTETQIVLFLIFFMIGIVPTAFVWGQMRSRTGSVWPVVIMHGVANALGFAILEGNLIEFNVDLLGSIAAGNLVLTLVWFGIAAWVWRQPIPSQNTIVAHPSN